MRLIRKKLVGKWYFDDTHITHKCVNQGGDPEGVLLWVSKTIECNRCYEQPPYLVKLIYKKQKGTNGWGI